jgi:biotin-(acetyl-CoA carboxylase) ligase
VITAESQAEGAPSRSGRAWVRTSGAYFQRTCFRSKASVAKDRPQHVLYAVAFLCRSAHKNAVFVLWPQQGLHKFSRGTTC